MTKGPILIISGTNRPNSNALKIATAVLGHYQSQGTPAEIYNLVDLPRELFDPQCYATKPPAFAAIQGKVLQSAGMHVVTPEYNGSFPGALKYFIDMLKFPESFDRKPVAYVGEAAGSWGAIRSVEQLQMIFGYRNAYSYPDRVFIPGVNQKLNPQGQLIDEDLNKRLATQTAGFTKFAATLA